MCTLLDLCVSSLRRGHANLLCIVPILTDDLRRGSTVLQRNSRASKAPGWPDQLVGSSLRACLLRWVLSFQVRLFRDCSPFGCFDTLVPIRNGFIDARNGRSRLCFPPAGSRSTPHHHGVWSRLFRYVRAAEVTLEVILCEYSRQIF